MDGWVVVRVGYRSTERIGNESEQVELARALTVTIPRYAQTRNKGKPNYGYTRTLGTRVFGAGVAGAVNATPLVPTIAFFPF